MRFLGAARRIEVHRERLGREDPVQGTALSPGIVVNGCRCDEPAVDLAQRRLAGGGQVMGQANR